MDTAINFVKRTAFVSASISAVIALGALVFGRARASVSIAAGSAIAIASFLVLAIVVIRSFGGGGKAGWLAALGMVKMCIIGAVLWWLLARNIVEPLAFLGGFSTMVVALVIEGVRRRR